MASYHIKGSRPVVGRCELPGSKNAVTKMLIAALLSEQKSTISNVPNIREIDLTVALLRSLGAKIERPGGATSLEVLRGEDLKPVISAEAASHNRMAVLAIAPILHLFGKITLPKNLGGDRIGPRPVNFHIDAYRQFGAEIKETGENFEIVCDELRGTTIELPYPSVSTTENILLAATLAKGTTLIRGAAVEPEVIDLVLFLQKMGAIIEQDTDRTYIVEGQDHLRGANHRVLPDRITCASLGVLAIATGGQIEIQGARQDHMLTFLNTLRRMKAPFEAGNDGIVFGNGRRAELKPVSLETGVHPGFMTDWQPPLVILMTCAEGMSVMHETVYENRLGYTETLNKMGADIQIDTRCLGGSPCRFRHKGHQHACIVHGRTPLRGLDTRVPDIRAGFTYVVAALCADGESHIENIEEIERGYGRLDELLRKMGADIRRLDKA